MIWIEFEFEGHKGMMPLDEFAQVVMAQKGLQEIMQRRMNKVIQLAALLPLLGRFLLPMVSRLLPTLLARILPNLIGAGGKGLLSLLSGQGGRSLLGNITGALSQQLPQFATLFKNPQVQQALWNILSNVLNQALVEAGRTQAPQQNIVQRIVGGVQSAFQQKGSNLMDAISSALRTLPQGTLSQIAQQVQTSPIRKTRVIILGEEGLTEQCK